MTTMSLAARRSRRGTADPPLDRRVLAAWAAMFFNVLPFSDLVTIVPIPGPVGQLIAQSALPLAFLLALRANPRGLVRPNVYVVALSLMALLALMVSLHNPFIAGSMYRALRFAGFVVVMWLLSPYWGRRDLLLLRCYRVCLLVVVGSLALGPVLAPGAAFAFQGRLGGVFWPIFPTQAAHYAAVLLGITALLWMCRVIGGRNAAIVIVVAVVVLILTHTRTALLAGTAGLVCASASLLLARSRARRAWLLGGLMATTALAAFASEVTTWLLRGQDSEEVTGLTGRTAVWTAALDHPRPRTEELFGSGMSNLSFGGNPIDSNWVGTYLDLGLLGVLIEVGLLLVLLLTALTRPSGPGGAVAIFLIVYCIFSSITEVGMSSPSVYLLDLAVASACLVRPAAGHPR